MIYIGIDPGVNGGIAAFNDGCNCLDEGFHAWRMPTTELGLLHVLRKFDSDVSIALLERVSASPQMGVVSAFTFGRGYGKLEMALAALDVPFDYITPQKWQRLMGCLSGGDKNVTKRAAQRLVPQSLTVTHALADALLIAACCRRLYEGVRHGKEEGRRQEETQRVQGQQAQERKKGARGGRQQSESAPHLWTALADPSR